MVVDIVLLPCLNCWLVFVDILVVSLYCWLVLVDILIASLVHCWFFIRFTVGWYLQISLFLPWFTVPLVLVDILVVYLVPHWLVLVNILIASLVSMLAGMCRYLGGSPGSLLASTHRYLVVVFWFTVGWYSWITGLLPDLLLACTYR